MTNESIERINTEISELQSVIDDASMPEETRKASSEALVLLESELIEEQKKEAKKLDAEKKRQEKIVAEEKRKADAKKEKKIAKQELKKDKPKVEFRLGDKLVRDASVADMTKSWEDRKAEIKKNGGKFKTKSPIVKSLVGGTAAQTA